MMDAKEPFDDFAFAEHLERKSDGAADISDSADFMDAAIRIRALAKPLPIDEGLVERLQRTIVALADGAEKCAEAPLFIVQPFLAIFKKHGETIAESRTAIEVMLGGR